MPTALHAWIWDYSAILCSYSKAEARWNGTAGQSFWMGLSELKSGLAQGRSLSVFTALLQLCSKSRCRVQSKVQTLSVKAWKFHLCFIRPLNLCYYLYYCILLSLRLLSGYFCSHRSSGRLFPNRSVWLDHLLEESWLFQTWTLTSGLGLDSDIHW